MDFRFLFSRIANIILDPVKAWETIHSENRPLKYVTGSFLFPLIILTALSAFLGSLLFTRTGFSDSYSILVGAKYFFLLITVTCLTAIIFREILRTLDLKGDFTLSFKIVAYSITPFLLCQIISRLIESFIFVNVLSLYCLYICWTGIEKMINPSEQKKIKVLIAGTVSFIGLFILMNWVLTQVIDKIYFSFLA